MTRGTPPIGAPIRRVRRARVRSCEQPLLVFEKKPFWSTWKNFCEALDNMEIRQTIAGCTTATTYTNCRAGAISGTCKCDVTTSRSGTCD